MDGWVAQQPKGGRTLTTATPSSRIPRPPRRHPSSHPEAKMEKGNSAKQGLCRGGQNIDHSLQQGGGIAQPSIVFPPAVRVTVLSSADVASGEFVRPE